MSTVSQKKKEKITGEKSYYTFETLSIRPFWILQSPDSHQEHFPVGKLYKPPLFLQKQTKRANILCGAQPFIDADDV